MMTLQRAGLRAPPRAPAARAAATAQERSPFCFPARLSPGEKRSSSPRIALINVLTRHCSRSVWCTHDAGMIVLLRAALCALRRVSAAGAAAAAQEQSPLCLPARPQPVGQHSNSPGIAASDHGPSQPSVRACACEGDGGNKQTRAVFRARCIIQLLGRLPQLRNKAPCASQPAPSPWGSVTARSASL